MGVKTPPSAAIRDAISAAKRLVTIFGVLYLAVFCVELVVNQLVNSFAVGILLRTVALTAVGIFFGLRQIDAITKANGWKARRNFWHALMWAGLPIWVDFLVMVNNHSYTALAFNAVLFLGLFYWFQKMIEKRLNDPNVMEYVGDYVKVVTAERKIAPEYRKSPRPATAKV
jgi:hypothetical protein